MDRKIFYGEGVLNPALIRVPVYMVAAVAGALFWYPIRAQETGNSCVHCHSNPDFLVTNKKLYDYYQDWKLSIHQQEGVDCFDCHGGNPDAKSKARAHGQMRGSKARTGVLNYENVPKTCGECHDDILSGFRKSEHFEHILKNKDGIQGPTCVTCHGSVSAAALNVNTVAEVCVKCHNPEKDLKPYVPEKAEGLLNRFLSLHRYYRYIEKRGGRPSDREFLLGIDALADSLSVTWHTFDLESISRLTDQILDSLKQRRQQILLRVNTDRGKSPESKPTKAKPGK